MAAGRRGHGSAVREDWVGSSRFLVNEPRRVAGQEVDVPQIHAFPGLIEPKSKANGYAWSRGRYLLVGTLQMFKVVRDNVHQLEFQRFIAPLLTENCDAESAFVGCAIDGMEDRHASKLNKSDRATVVVEIVKVRIDGR